MIGAAKACFRKQLVVPPHLTSYGIKLLTNELRASEQRWLEEAKIPPLGATVLKLLLSFC